MIIASDRTAARAYAALLTKLTSEAPTVVLSDDPGSSARISRIRRGHRPVAGRGAHGLRRRRRAPAVGRDLRHQRLDAAVLRAGHRPVRAVAPAGRNREHLRAVGAQPAAAGQRAGGPAQPRARRAAPRSRRSPRRRSRRQDADREERHGQRASPHWAPTPNWIRSSSTDRRSAPPPRPEATRRPITSASPGCSTPSRCAPCCTGAKTSSCKKRVRRRGGAAGRRCRCMASSAICAVSSTPSSRSTHHRTGKPHGWIHSELRRRCGGPPIAAATREQIQARIDALRQLNSEQS